MYKCCIQFCQSEAKSAKFEFTVLSETRKPPFFLYMNIFM